MSLLNSRSQLTSLLAVSVLLLPASNANATADTTLRINVGGPGYTDSQSQQWSADYGYNTGRRSTTSATISGTNDPTLYQTERWDAGSAPELSYSFAMANGSYQVRLHFAETYSGTMGVGLRVFDVRLEGKEILTDLDIYAEAGANSALVKTFLVTVSDGVLDIEFLRKVQNPELRALEIYSNKPPVIEPIAARSVPAGQYSVFRVIATDPEGITPILSCVSCPEGAFFSAATGLFFWSPSPNTDVGEPYRLVFRAVDAIDPQLVVERAAYITVADNAPELELVQDVTVREGETLELPLNAAAASGQPELSVMIFDAPLASTLEARGVQASFERTSSATYYDKTGKLIHVPAGTPRFLDDGRGILIEGQRTNLVAPSINLGSDPWVDNFGGAAVDNFGIAPDGSRTSSLLIGNTSPFAGRKIPVPLVREDHYESRIGRYALKVHLKAGSSQRSRHGIYNNTSKVWEGFVDLEWKNGVPRTIDSGNTRHIYLEDTGYQGWWTLVFRFPEINEGNITREISDQTYFHVEPDRQGTSGTLEVWGAQVEAGFISTSYIHNTTTIPKVRASDLLTYDIANFALGFPSNNVMVESEYYPQWGDGEYRGWHPRLWGSKVDGSTYFLARTSQSSPNFVVTRTNNDDARQEDVTLSTGFSKGDLVRVAARAQRTADLEILPNFFSDGTAVGPRPGNPPILPARQDQPWGDQLMVGNLTGLRPSNFSVLETDGPLNSPTRHLRVHVLNAPAPNQQGVSLLNGVFIWTPSLGASRQDPYIVTVRATDPTDPSNFVQQDVEIRVLE